MSRQQNIKSLIDRFNPHHVRIISQSDGVGLYMYSVVDVAVSGEYKDVKFGYSKDKKTLYVFESKGDEQSCTHLKYTKMSYER